MLKKSNKVQKNETHSKHNLITKYVLFILTCLLALSTITYTVAWYNGIRFNLNGDSSLTISKLSSLKDNVDIIGYSYNPEYVDGTSSLSSYLTTTPFLTEKNTTADSTNQSLFSGDYFEPGAINKLASQTTENVNNVIDTNTNTKYIKVVNRSDLDINVKMQFILNDGQNSSDLDCFWYLTTEVTNDVLSQNTGNDNLDEKLAMYAMNNIASRNNDYNENNVNAKIFTNLTKRVKLGEILEPVNSSTPRISIYRIDYGLCESALRSSGSNYFGRNIKSNVYIFYGQVNATDDEDISVHSEIRVVHNEEELLAALSNVTTTYNGDTIQLANSFEVNGDLVINRPFNFDMNGNTLTVRNGNFIINHTSAMSMTFNLTKNGAIHIISDRDEINGEIRGNFEINTPYGAVTIVGDNAKSAGPDYCDIKMISTAGKIYNGCGNVGEGLKLDSVYIEQYTYPETASTPIDTDTAIICKDGARLTIGSLVDIDYIGSNQVNSLFVHNSGNVGHINFASVQLTNQLALKLYLYNNGFIGNYTGKAYVSELTNYGVVVPVNTRPANTQFVKGPLSNNFSMYGSKSFTQDDIIDENQQTVLVVPIENETQAYEVFLNPNTPTDVNYNSKIAYALSTKFEDESPYSSIKKLVITAKKGVYIDENDINFLHASSGTGASKSYKFRDLEYLDLTNCSIKQTNYADTNERLNRVPQNAFNGMSNLTTVLLPEDIIYIGDGAFYGTGITKVTIPSNVAKIGAYAFNNVIEATLLSYNPVNNTNNFLPGFTKNTYFFVDETAVDVYKAKYTSFKDHIYCFASRVDNFFVRVLDEDLRSLEIVAYVGDAYGTNVTPSTIEFEGIAYYVTSLGRDSYINMTNTTSTTLKLNVGEYVTHIGKEAFINEPTITSVSAPALTQVDEKAFYNCDFIERITIGGEAVLGKQCFADCAKLTYITMAKCIEIGESTFANDTSIRNLEIPKVKVIGTKAFNGCKAFETVVFGELEELSDSIFQNCVNLQTVQLTQATKRIGKYAFSGCSALTSICSVEGTFVNNHIILDYVETIDEYAFANCFAVHYVTSNSIKTINKYAFNNCKNLEYVNIPSVEEIGNNVFYNLTNLKQAKITNCEKIGYAAFYQTGLLYIDIPNATSIGSYAFYKCSNALEITFGTPNVIDKYAFFEVQPKYIDFSGFNISRLSTMTILGGATSWHKFNSNVKFYYDNSIGSSKKTELFNIIYNTYEYTYVNEQTGQEYTTNLRSNISEKYFFGKEYFACSWLIESSDNLLSKDIYSYNIQVHEDASHNYTGTIVSYHGKDLIGNIVLPFTTYPENGLLKSEYEDKSSSCYDGTITVKINGVDTVVTITEIGYYAFENVNASYTEASLTDDYAGDRFVHLSFANTITTIGEGAFRYSKIQFLEMNQVLEIEKDAFRNTTQLRYVDLGEVETIRSYAFSSYQSDDPELDIRYLYTKNTTHNFNLSGFSSCILTKVIFRHVDTIELAAFFYNYGSAVSFTVLDFTINEPGHKTNYTNGYGDGGKYDIPTTIDTLWLGYNDKSYAFTYARNYSYNDVNILAPYVGGLAQNVITTKFNQFVPSGHLYYYYGYTYMPEYKMNDVEVGMFWLKPEDENNLDHGFFIVKSNLRNLGSDYTVANVPTLVLTKDGDTKRYTYTVPDTLNGADINYTNDPTGRTGTRLNASSNYRSYLSSASFKNTNVASKCIVDLNLGELYTEIPSSCFMYSGFRNIYLNNVQTINNSAFDACAAGIVYAYKLNYIGASVFYASSIQVLDMRENKDDDGNPIPCTFDRDFMYDSYIQSIYVDESQLDYYVSQTKGIAIRNNNYSEIELYVYFKVVGTFVGSLDLLNTSSYNFESLISPYKKNDNETIRWEWTDHTRFTVIDGVITVNIDEDSITKTQYESGTTTVYCYKDIAGSGGTTTTLLGKFDVKINTDENDIEYYNFVLSERMINNQKKYGYRIISYYGNNITGLFNPSERFNTFMNAHITTDEKSANPILNHTIYEKTEFTTEEEHIYTIFEIAQGAYMNMGTVNDSIINLYTNKYITKISDYAFYLIPFKEVWCEAVTTISRRAFYNSSTVIYLDTVVIPEIEVIESQAFYEDSELLYVVVGDNYVSKLTSIGSYAFGSTYNLSKFGVIKTNFTDEENNYGYSSSYIYNKLDMYDYIGRFDEIPLLEWVKNIDVYEYENADGEKFTYYSNAEFYDQEGADDKFIYLPNSVKNVDTYAFNKAILIEQLHYSENEEVTTVGAYAFVNCSKLHYVVLGENITAIGDYAFAYCEKLKPAHYVDYYMHVYTASGEYEDILTEIHEHYDDGINLHWIKTIGKGAFRNCYSFDYIYLDSIESIGSEAFKECENLRYIDFEMNDPSEELYNHKVVFGSNWDVSTHALRRYYVPGNKASYFSGAVYTYVRDESLKEKEAELGNYQLKYVRNESTNEVLGVEIVCFNGNKLENIPEYFIIDGDHYNTVIIGSYAYHGFGSNENCETINLPRYVTKVRDHAFDGALFKYYIEEDRGMNACVTYGSYIFNQNTILETATFKRMVEGGAYFFNGCANFKKIDLSNNLDSSNLYFAPVIDDNFFGGSPATCECSVNPDYISYFSAAGYLGKVYESTSKTVDGYRILELPGNTVSIVRYVGTDALQGNYVVPSTLDGKTVTKISMGAFKDVDVRTGSTLTIPATITEIGEYAFSNTFFTSVTFDSVITNITIGNSAFANMKYLNTANLSSITNLTGENVFEGCVTLYSVTLNNTITAIPAYYFYKCANLETLTIGTSCRTIGDHAFDSCTSLKMIMVEGEAAQANTIYLKYITKIGEYAFNNCGHIKAMVALEVTEIGAYAFKNCSELTAVTFRPTLEIEFGKGVFYGCESLTSASAYTSYVPDECYYGCTSLSSFYTNSATSIGNSAFMNCTSLENFDFGNVYIIGEYAFRNCSNLKTINIDKVQTVNKYAFYNCNLQGTTINGEDHVLDLNTIETIGDYAFGLNTTIEKVIFRFVKKIGSNVFYKDVYIQEFDFTANMNKLDSYTYLSEPTGNSNAFDGMNGDFIIYVPGSIISNYENRFSRYAHRIFELGQLSTNGLYMTKDVTINDGDHDVSGVEIVRYLGSNLSGEVDIPTAIDGKTVISVGRYAYYNAYNKYSETTILNVGTNVLNIGDYAFYDFEFETISMPNVQTIGKYAFFDNDSLTYLSLPKAVEVDNYAFSSCGSLQLVRFYDTLQYIGAYCFYQCDNLRSVYLANTTNLSTLKIGSKYSTSPYNFYAFGNVTNNPDLIIRVPSSKLTEYSNLLTYYKDFIKKGSLDEADFSYRLASDGVIEIIAYEGQATAITIPSSITIGDVSYPVKRILENAFENSLNLQTVTIPSELESISSHAFLGNSSISRIATNGSASTGFKAIDDVLYYVENDIPKTLIYYPIAKTNTTFTFSSSLMSLATVDMIYENAFYGNSYIKDITIPSTVRYIGENAFAYLPKLEYVEFLVGGTATVPTLYGSNIFTNSNSTFQIVIANQTLLQMFKSDKYFGYYKARMISSRGGN